jgi:hypothetical protein
MYKVGVGSGTMLGGQALEGGTIGGYLSCMYRHHRVCCIEHTIPIQHTAAKALMKPDRLFRYEM